MKRYRFHNSALSRKIMDYENSMSFLMFWMYSIDIQYENKTSRVKIIYIGYKKSDFRF